MSIGLYGSMLEITFSFRGKITLLCSLTPLGCSGSGLRTMNFRYGDIPPGPLDPGPGETDTRPWIYKLSPSTLSVQTQKGLKQQAPSNKRQAGGWAHKRQASYPQPCE